VKPILLIAGVAAALTATGCRSDPPPQPKEVLIWHQVGTWSGRGDKQTETFTSDTGGFRVHWETTNESPGAGGRLRVVFRSGDSGREIIEAIDALGAGRGIEEVAAERPRWYYLTIESANVDWAVTVDERIEGTTVKGSP
jgi:ABC-type glycerol-3-phosphate transport system substrate-binding protein